MRTINLRQLLFWLAVMICITNYRIIVRADEIEYENINEINEVNSNCLMVNIMYENGESILVKNGSTFYTARPLKFIINMEQQAYYSFSIDGGNTYSEYVPMQDNTVTLYPNNEFSPDGNYILRFKCNDLTSYDYNIQFDFNPPQVSLINEELLNRWLTCEEGLEIALVDDTRISRVLATLNGEIIAENHFTSEESIGQFVTLPLNVNSYENEGQNILLHVYDEADNESIVSYNYYLQSDSSKSAEGDLLKNDNEPPQIMIEGVTDNVDAKGPVNVMIGISEASYENCDVDIKVLRRRGDEEKWIPVDNCKMQSPKEVRMLSLVNDGDYTISVSAKDAKGMSSFVSSSFRIDANAPLLKISGISDEAATNEAPTIRVNALECFYDATILTSNLYKMGNTGERQLVDTYNYVMKSKQDYQDIKVNEEGDYELIVAAADRSGNVRNEKIDFTVDYTPPVIGKLEEYDGKYFKKAFIEGKSLAALISDMTHTSYEAFINDDKLTEDQEIIEEGKYTLYLSATDEANNASLESATFIVDRTAPQITIRGMKADGYIRKGDKITVGLNDADDELLEVKYNGAIVPVDKARKVANFTADEYGEYNIEVRAIDKAGNETNKLIHSNCVAMSAPLQNIVKNEKMLTSNLVDSDKNDIDFKGAIIGVITMLSGTFGLVFRAIRAD